MRKNILCLFVLTSSLAWTSCSNDRSKDSTDVAEDQNEETLGKQEDDDADFAVEAADGGLLEVTLGTLAVTKASSPEVKQFAQVMVDEHSAANNELKALAQQKNIALPTVMGDAHQRKYDNCNEKTGADFDREYIDLMVKDHKEDVEEFEEQAREGNDPELKAWASGKVATLRKHLDEAQRLQNALKQ